MIVLDASVLIAHFDVEDRHHDPATALLRATTDAWGISPITRAEVLVGPARAGHLELAEAALLRLEVDDVPLGDDAPARLAVMRAATGLRLPDCCVLLAAEDRRAGVATFDARLRAVAEDRGLPALPTDGGQRGG